MEFTVAYFWLIKLVFTGIILFFGWLGYKRFKKTKKVFNIYSAIFIILMSLSIVNPLKIDGSKTKETLRMQNSVIEQNHFDIPPKVSDDSFKKSVEKDITISDKDIDLK